MNTIKVVPLGAGQDVGRSCLLLTIGNKNIMLDCGMHMGYNDHRRYPDFSYISKNDDFSILDAIIISHFHLDHCGALPYFTEICGYDGPIYMSHPTKAIAPLLLEDMRKVCVDRKQETNFFTASDIKNCMRKVIAVDLHEVIQVDEQIEIKAYYAGHVLGASMFHIKVTDMFGASQTVVYSGDYNMTPDRHLGSAWIEPCEPDLLITESTYATTIRDSKRARERDFLKKVHDAVSKGGKVLVPVFALGRAQELLILLESYWERMSDLHNIPIYFSAGLTERANDYYKLFISWTNEKIKKTFVEHNMFDFSLVKVWKPEYANEPGPMVLFASPGMLHAGTSLTVFTKWCHDPLNMVIMPGYCVAGTVGAKVLAGEKTIDIDRFKSVVVNIQVKNLSFSAHADAKGIMALISMAKAKNVMLVHGEKLKMEQLKKRIEAELGVPTYDPANGVTVTIQTKPNFPISVPKELIDAAYLKSLHVKKSTSLNDIEPLTSFPIKGSVIITKSKAHTSQSLILVDSNVSQKAQRIDSTHSNKHYKIKKPFNPLFWFNSSSTKSHHALPTTSISSKQNSLLKQLHQLLHQSLSMNEKDIVLKDRLISVGTTTIEIQDAGFLVSCMNPNDAVVIQILSIINLVDLSKC
ncbi:beta-lactamase-like protein [Globomyces pollinis-pini]|nr:beta-lactamase-like protein [Globomyces pollinis-pini]